VRVRVLSGAVLDVTRTYRYLLWRQIAEGSKHVAWIMLNPSVADADIDDPTIRRCISFSRALGFDRLTVANLFALRSTDPRALRTHSDPIGPNNDKYLVELVKGADLVICAWGNHGALNGRAAQVCDLLKGSPLHCLRISKHGQPVHPLYLPAALRPVSFGAA
jgi:hypothetical protein